MIFSYFKNRREVLDWMTAIGWYITHGLNTSNRLVFLLMNDRGRCLCQDFHEDYLLVWADTYAYGCVDEYNVIVRGDNPAYAAGVVGIKNHIGRITELAEAALSICSKKGN